MISDSKQFNLMGFCCFFFFLFPHTFFFFLGGGGGANENITESF